MFFVVLRSACVMVTFPVLLFSSVSVSAHAAPVRDGVPEARAATKTSATVLLSRLSVKSEQNSGYSRELFKLWTTKNGCTTRNQVLKDESLVPVKVTSRCAVVSGKWRSPYDNVVVTNPRGLDIDHVVPLQEAWGSGASKWNSDRRKNYANDLGYSASLIAVTAHSNRSKGDDDIAEWQPENVKYLCTYATNWVSVKYRWKLAVDGREKTALQKIFKKCGNPTVTVPPLS